MTFFPFSVQVISLVSLLGLILYALWLLRSGRLQAQIVLQWVLAAGVAMVAILLWSWLPLFRFTSGMGNRELLVILAVVFFVFIAFLMLDCLVRISTHTYQIKRLTQEVALLRAQVESKGVPQDAAQPTPVSPELQPEKQESPSRKTSRGISTLLGLWAVAVVAVAAWQVNGFPSVIKAFLTAGYQQ